MKRETVSLYPSITAVEKNSPITLGELVRGIAEPTEQIRNIITTIRNLPKDRFNVRSKSLKTTLPAVTFCGTFKANRSAENGWISKTGLICLDIDKVLGDVERYKEDIANDPHTLAVFKSPSGNGLKVLIKSQYDNSNQFKALYNSLESYYSLKHFVRTDSNCSDYNRLCFLSYDPDIYVNWDAEEYEYEFTEEETEPVDEILPIDNDDKHEDVKKLITKLEADKLDITSSYDDWLKIGFALAHQFGEDGRIYYRQISSLYDGYDYVECENQYNSCLRYFEGKNVTLKTLFGIAKQKGVIVSNPTAPVMLTQDHDSPGTIENDNHFWYVERDVVKISHTDLYSYLEQQGFYSVEKNGVDIFVQIKDNIVVETSKKIMKNCALNYVNAHGDKAVKDTFRKNVNNLFSNGLLDLLTQKELTYLRDTKKKVYKSFKNGIVKVTKKDIELIPYNQIDGYVWKEDIIDHKFDNQSGKTDFKKFCKLISNSEESPERYKSLRSILGYALSNYKSPSLTKAIIFCDEQYSDQPQGGTGKGLLSKALACLTNAATIEGKGFAFNKGFKFQRVTNSTKLIHFEDVEKNFDFEKLFNVITDGISVEKKHKDEKHIPFKDSPKIIISTNYVVNGVGDSNDRRRVEFELHPHFNAGYSPEDEFGKLMFNEWNNKEWNAFHHYMFNCIQYFLKKGVVEPPQINIQKRKLVQNTSYMFSEWANNYIINNVRYDRAILHSDYQHAENIEITKKSFFGYLATYAELKRLEREESRSGNNIFYTFVDNSQRQLA